MPTRVEFPVDGHVLQFDNNKCEGLLVFTCIMGTYTIKFNKADTNFTYKQSVEGDRVRFICICGYDNQPWYIKDGSLELICRAEPVSLANAT